jgi:hypothetical protein
MPLWGSFVRAYHKPTTSAPLMAAAIDTCTHHQQQQQQHLKSGRHKQIQQKVQGCYQHQLLLPRSLLRVVTAGVCCDCD